MKKGNKIEITSCCAEVSGDCWQRKPPNISVANINLLQHTTCSLISRKGGEEGCPVRGVEQMVQGESYNALDTGRLHTA